MARRMERSPLCLTLKRAIQFQLNARTYCAQAQVELSMDMMEQQVRCAVVGTPQPRIAQCVRRHIRRVLASAYRLCASLRARREHYQAQLIIVIISASFATMLLIFRVDALHITCVSIFCSGFRELFHRRDLACLIELVRVGDFVRKQHGGVHICKQQLKNRTKIVTLQLHDKAARSS